MNVVLMFKCCGNHHVKVPITFEYNGAQLFGSLTKIWGLSSHKGSYKSCTTIHCSTCLEYIMFLTSIPSKFHAIHNNLKGGNEPFGLLLPLGTSINSIGDSIYLTISFRILQCPDFARPTPQGNHSLLYFH